MSTQPTWDNSASGQAPSPSRTNGLAIAALVMGIIALLISWIPAINLFGALLAIAALITGFLGLRNAKDPGVGGRGLAIGGLVTGALALLITVLVYAGLAAVFSDPEVQRQLEEIQEATEPAG